MLNCTKFSKWVHASFIAIPFTLYFGFQNKTQCLCCHDIFLRGPATSHNNIEHVCMHNAISKYSSQNIMASIILERGITLIHPYSRNKSDYTDLIYVSCCFCNRLVRKMMVKWKLLQLSIILLAWLTVLNLELTIKMNLENKREIKSVESGLILD